MAVQKNKISLIISDKLFDKGWDTVRVRSSMDNLSIDFSFECTQPQPFKLKEWPIRMGAPCKILVADKQVAQGYIDEVNVSYSGTSHTVQVTGRDRLGDIVDCCVAGESGSVFNWEKTSGASIIRQLLKPYGINVVIDPSAAANMALDLLPQGVQGGDPVMDLVQQIIKLRGAIGIATSNGNLLITQASTSKASKTKDSIVAGKNGNVLSGSIKQSNKDRFQWYYVKGYDYTLDAKAIKHMAYFQRYKDTSIDRFRATAITAESFGDFFSGGKRAQWEAKYRAGKSRVYTYTVQGWTQSNGELWDVNKKVDVYDEQFALGVKDSELERTLLINSVEWSQSVSKGSITTLTLCSPKKWEAKAQLDKIKAMNDLGGDNILPGKTKEEVKTDQEKKLKDLQKELKEKKDLVRSGNLG